jgi:hypothetical protein
MGQLIPGTGWHFQEGIWFGHCLVGYHEGLGINNVNHGPTLLTECLKELKVRVFSEVLRYF